MRKLSCSSKKLKLGFTLIELITVIVILGILSAIAAPKFINLSGDATAAFVMQLKESIDRSAKYIEMVAMLRKDTSRARFDSHQAVWLPVASLDG